ncbi:hypothetical protein I307_06311 [Cryptococcus deuterogattii 99/473]|uniref:Unplaced genomic scaffold supercont1.9, whole genome shotgun sequence n=1 Tax=Cryptococcus deuterogattii Ram5 TaxID=1296110 RepID=A0A0D0V5F7_9TREE|nr:hypothetical protein I309_06144 [Cryptococcus deuterogattii LA55]KIR31309.1 hypothetical protein I352_06403 [Cryptococcus deuterogattii MMRL2647]KIR40195.1 hypothetical protein I313_04116 [Cryptococcus deuterogattii Ram5]KIR71589.1 hypothetical protein I310_04896 [Cryptococcus deuterogattii CA1014]KIR91170.1 hypothetical protein I304_05266 [Cryptococcus deuterogattii CBS 10090]KIR96367.1 hypothetical protein L804_06202 [Cryptococcus deuterogattii 2001/935-1]KIY54368.1 hypothetical protein 
MSLIRTTIHLSRPSVSFTRFLHSSRRVLASEVPPNPFEDPIFKAFADRVKQHQGAVDAMKGLMSVMQQKDLKAAASVLMSELQKAGVNQTEAMEIFKKASSR